MTNSLLLTIAIYTGFVHENFGVYQRVSIDAVFCFFSDGNIH
jgi:hypothetical protein